MPQGARSDSQSPFELVGRVDELIQLSDFVTRCSTDGGALLLFGDPGVGKTALLEVVAELASAAGTRVLRARGVEFEVDLPYAGLHQLLLPLHPELVGLSDAHRGALEVALGFGVGDAPDRLLVSNATLSLVSAAGRAAPLLLVIDDLPWIDRVSASVLGFVARRLEGTRVGLMAASRTGEESLFSRAGLPETEIEPLDDSDARRLIEHRFPALVDGTRERVLTEAQGNPLAILELSAAVSARNLTDESCEPSTLPVSNRLHDLFAARIGALPAETRDPLLILALDGTGELPVPTAEAGRSWVADLAEAERFRLTRLDPRTQRPTFRHPLIRSAVVTLSSEADRRRAHQALADLWASQPERRAWHLYQATSGTDDHVANLLEQAALHVLGRGDGVAAVSNLTRAAELSTNTRDRSRRLAAAANIGADVTGDVGSASQLLAAAHEADPDFSGTLQAATAAAYVLMNGDGNVDTAHRLLAAAIDNDKAATPEALEEALGALALICFFGSRSELWHPFNDALARLGSDVPTALMLLRDCFADPARATADSISKLEDALAGLDNQPDPAVILKVGFAAGNLDRLPKGRTAFSRVHRESRQAGAIGWSIQALILLAFDDWWSGRWDDATSMADEALALCKEHGFPLFALSGQHVNAAVAAARGDMPRAAAILDEMVQWGRPRGVGLVKVVDSHVRTIDALGRGDFDAAYRSATQISPVGTLASHILMAPWVMMDVVESAARTSRHAEAQAHLDAINDTGLASISSRFALLAAGATAIAAAPERAGELYEKALATPEAERWPLLRARIELAFGEHLRRARSTKDARIHLIAALDEFERLGATPFAKRAATELRASGLSQTTVARRDRFDLTPQEREIALLAASGLSNKEIGQRLLLSHRTVGAHLYRIFPKMGITSRAALRDALDALQPDRDSSRVG